MKSQALWLFVKNCKQDLMLAFVVTALSTRKKFSEEPIVAFTNSTDFLLDF